MSKSTKRIILVNAIYAPDKGATAQAAYDFAIHASARDIDLSIVCTDRNYKQGSDKPAGNVLRIKSFSTVRNKWRRLVYAVIESYRLISKARKLSADFYLICTDPPLLHLFSALMLQKKKWILWTMDLYPEAFVANGLITSKNILFKWYRIILKMYPPTAVIYLGKHQKKMVEDEYNFKSSKSFILPCGTKHPILTNASRPKWKNADNKIYFGYCGNLGLAHSFDFLRELIEYSDSDRHAFVLSIFGAYYKDALQYAKTKTNVLIIDWIPAAEMSFLDIQIVSLKKEWTHVCVPSKAVSSICYDLPFVFHGDKSSDIYDQYSEALWHIDEVDISKDISSFYAKLDQEEVKKKQQKAKELRELLWQYEKGSIAQILKYIVNE